MLLEGSGVGQGWEDVGIERTGLMVDGLFEAERLGGEMDRGTITTFAQAVSARISVITAS